MSLSLPATVASVQAGLDALAAAYAQETAATNVLINSLLGKINEAHAQIAILTEQVRMAALELAAKEAQVKADIAKAQAKVMEATKPEVVVPALQRRVEKRKQQARVRAKRA